VNGHQPTGKTRDPGLDLLRTLAVLRVFFWHATGWAALTWIGALPVMFYVTGVLLARSISAGGVRRALADRARRLLVPFWFFAGLMLTVMFVVAEKGTFPPLHELGGWLLPLTDPVGAPWQDGWITQPLWYLRTYTWFLVAAAPLLWLLRRSTTATLAAFAALTLLGEVVLGNRFWPAQDFVTYGFFFAAGMAVSVGTLTLTPRRGGILALVVLPLVAVWSVLRFPQDGVVNNAHFLHLLVGVLWVGAAQRGLPRLRVMAGRDVLRPFVTFINQRSLSFYLWHAPVIGASYLLLARIGLTRDLPGTLLIAAISLTVTLTLLPLVGVAEDLGGRRARYPRVAPRSLIGVGVVAVAAAGLTSLPAPAELSLPPTPSRAPAPVDFTTDETSEFLLSPAKDQLPAGTDPAIAGQRSSDRAPGVDGRRPPRTSSESEPAAPAPGPVTPAPPAVSRPPRAVGPWEQLAPAVDAGLLREIEDRVVEWVRSEKYHGTVEVALLQPGRRRLLTAVTGNGERVENSVVLPLNSITKSFTAALLLRAVEERRIGLSEPVGRLDAAPWFTLVDGVTVRDLLGHRTGIPNYTATKAYQQNWRSISGWEQALRAVEETGRDFAAGARTEYSSTNYVIAGLLLEQLYGAPVENLIERDLLRPLGLTRTSVGPPVPGSPGTGTGNMTAHITDLARWGVAMWRDKTVLGPEGNALAAYTDPAKLMGYGSFSYCPCRPGKNGSVVTAGIGANGSKVTVRYYQAVDTLIVVRVPDEVTTALEDLIEDLLRYTR